MTNGRDFRGLLYMCPLSVWRVQSRENSLRPPSVEQWHSNLLTGPILAPLFAATAPQEPSQGVCEARAWYIVPDYVPDMPG